MRVIKSIVLLVFLTIDRKHVDGEVVRYFIHRTPRVVSDPYELRERCYCEH